MSEAIRSVRETGAVIAAITAEESLPVIRGEDICPAGPYFPTNLTNDAAVGDVAWSNPTNAATSNDSYATVVLTAIQTSNRLIFFTVFISK